MNIPAIGVLIIGDEILSGRYQDKHLPKAIELLAERGLQLSWARYCGDDRPRLTAMLRDSFASDDIVFSFGGIGATPDDHTRQCAAAALGRTTVLHAEAAALIEEVSRERYGECATPERLVMGEFPQGAELIPNPFNRIPGFAIDRHYFVPGFPQMAWPMMAWVLDSHYAHLHHQRDWVEEAIAVYEAHESQLLSLMDGLQQRFGVTVFSLPHLESTAAKDPRRFIELGAKGAADAVRQAMATMRAEMTQRGHPWCEMVDAGDER